MIYYPSYYDTEPKENPISYLRFFNASPDIKEIDVYSDDKTIVKKLKFKEFTEYIPLKSGMYRIRIYESSSKKQPIIDGNVFLPPKKIFTAAAAGYLHDISLKLINDEIKKIHKGMAMVRFSNLSPNSPPLDLYLPNGKKIFSNTDYEEAEGYITINPKEYRYDIKASATDKIILKVPNVRIQGDKIYTIYVIGLLNEKPPLQVVIPLDGNTYLKF